MMHESFPVLRGPVVRGKQLGRTLGFPTANVDADTRLPMDGVYVARIVIEGIDGEHFCMLNQGHHPTAPEGLPTVEAYILDFNEDIYGRTVELRSDAFLRPERRYDGLDALVRQLNFDRARTRNYYTHGGLGNMENTYTTRVTLGPSRCDLAGRQSVTDIFERFQDIAGEHAERLGIGLGMMNARGLYWTTARSKVVIRKRAKLLEEVELTTWPKAPGVTRCDRCYQMRVGDECIAEGRTEWCVVDVGLGKAVSPAGLFPDGFEFREDTAAEGPYARFPHDFKEDELVLTVPVRACEIDIGRHLNNVAYVRLLTDTFDAETLAAMDVSAAEILYLSPAKEGDTLRVYRRATEKGYVFGVKNDRTYVALAGMEL